MDIGGWLKSLWAEHIRPRLAVLFDEVFGDLKESELFELAVERGRIAVRSLMEAEPGVTNEAKARMVEDQIKAELERLGYRARTHLIESARVFAYRSVLKDMGDPKADFVRLRSVPHQPDETVAR